MKVFQCLSQSRGRGCLRILMLLLGVTTLSGCQVLQSIDKGLYDVAEAVTETDRVTGQRALSTANRNQQIALGNQYVDKLLQDEQKQGRKVDSALDTRQYRRLVRIFDRIHPISHLRQERWKPVLIDRDSFNAFTTGGTYIVVHLGLMKQLNDAEVAAVVGHEIAHTVANHVAERQTHQQLSGLTSSSAVRRKGYQAAFTHEREREADRIGILYSALAGFDPYAASRIWQRQYQQQGNARSLFAHDHPVNAERSAEAKAVADKVKQYYRAGKVNPQAHALLDNNTLWQKRSNRHAESAGEGGGVAAILSTAVGVMAEHQQAKQEEYRQAQQAQFVRSVQQSMRLEEQRWLNDRSWQTRWHYTGNLKLHSVVMGIIARDSQGKTYRFVGHHKGVLTPGQRFNVSFMLNKNMTLNQLERMQTQYYLDDALPVR
ncbi:M48 family metallopeptidase [Aliamphritea ceti]|uniref:M48 family metallopeptidase n=1 Tax=Aliamphritea ceti TaxID=1524258 RepID=UPI0021C344DB|nr:M48 family metallopeptidase [Aliamphritea ceti]